MSAEEILFEVKGQVGLITLNRPKALNAINADMCYAVRKQLAAWAKDDAIKAVVIRGEGDRAFCAGGDVVSLYKSGLAYRGGDKNSLEWRRFFNEEYRMNVAIKEFPKPYIALLDGITMGGGVGISVHGSHRIATERTMLAMPETGLGLIPDVGGSWFMPRLDGEIGMYLALTGDRLKAAETCALGITLCYIPSKNLHWFIEDIIKDASDIEKSLNKFREDPGEGKLASHEGEIERLFAGNSVEDILQNLESEGTEWATTWHGRLLKKSPTSMKVTYKQMREGRVIENFREIMKMEYRIVNHIITGNDFFEGVRAILLDKDNKPSWNPAAVADVSEAAVARHFESLGDDELTFD